MLFYLTVIFTCQLIGEVAVKAAGAPLPGPVAGMVLLFCSLLVRGTIPDDLAKIADTLLGNLSLLFVPAGVGVMLHAKLLSKDWMAISFALVASTAATIAVTALVMVWLSPGSGRAHTRAGKNADG